LSSKPPGTITSMISSSRGWSHY